MVSVSQEMNSHAQLLFNPTHALTYTIKHQLTLTFKTLKNLLKTFWRGCPYMFRSTH